MEFVDREVGQFPLSIGTSLALEGLLHIHPNQPRQPSGYKSIRTVWVNLRTLIRNLHAAMTAEKARKLKYEDATFVIMEELKTIPEVLRQHGRNIDVVFYYSDLNELKWMFPKALYTKPKTERQIYYDTYERMVLSMLLTHLREQGMPVTAVKRNPENVNAVAAILTHYPHELLWKPQFERLFLLESHTGKLKMYNHWHTKLNGIKEETPMPFNQYTLQVYGEGVLFMAQPKTIRDELKQLSEYRRWSAVTSYEKVKGDIATLGSRELKANFAELIR